VVPDNPLVCIGDAGRSRRDRILSDDEISQANAVERQTCLFDG
jgi:hypothetical protein